jgi:hypothetical protein
MSDTSEFKVRRVMDVDAIKEDPDAVYAFTGMIHFLVTENFLRIVASPPPGVENFDPIAVLIGMLMDKYLILVNYGDPHEASDWVIEIGPEHDPAVTVIPFDISMN